jgi:hypothetical protein
VGHGTLDLCQRLGVRIVKVDEPLPKRVMFDPESGVAFVSTVGCPDELTEWADGLLAALVAAQARSARN